MARASLSFIDLENIDDHLKILTYDGYWARVMYLRSNKSMTIRKIWEVMESDLDKLGAEYYTTFISFKRNLFKYVERQDAAAAHLDNLDMDSRLFSSHGYWSLVEEMRRDTNLLVQDIWKQLENKLEAKGFRKYSSFSSFKTAYGRHISNKLKK